MHIGELGDSCCLTALVASTAKVAVAVIGAVARIVRREAHVSHSSSTISHGWNLLAHERCACMNASCTGLDDAREASPPELPADGSSPELTGS
jgi:hypothetical protein